MHIGFSSQIACFQEAGIVRVIISAHKNQAVLVKRGCWWFNRNKIKRIPQQNKQKEKKPNKKKSAKTVFLKVKQFW